MRPRGYVALVGALAVLAGVAVLVDPSLTALVGLGSDRVLVTVLALLALVQGLLATRSRFTREGRAAAFEPVETRFRAAVPGDEFDELLADLPDLRVKRRDRERAAVRDRLESLAVAVLVARGLDEEHARRHLEAGTWTVDERAASFFIPATDRDLSVGARLRDAFGPDLAFARRARRAVAAIAAHAAGEVPPPGAGEAARNERVPAAAGTATDGGEDGRGQGGETGSVNGGDGSE